MKLGKYILDFYLWSWGPETGRQSGSHVWPYRSVPHSYVMQLRLIYNTHMADGSWRRMKSSSCIAVSLATWLQAASAEPELPSVSHPTQVLKPELVLMFQWNMGNTGRLWDFFCVSYWLLPLDADSVPAHLIVRRLTNYLNSAFCQFLHQLWLGPSWLFTETDCQ